MFKVQCKVRVGGCCVCVCYLAEECGLELSCGVAGVKKLTKGHLEWKKEGELVKYRHCNPECSKYRSLQSQIFWNELCHSVCLRYECVTCLTGGGTVLYLTQKTAAIKPMSLKITKAVSGAETEQTWWITWWATLPYTATAVTWNTRVQYLVWAQRRWDWRIKYWWGSYQPTGRERCPTPTSEWATSSRCNRPAELEKQRQSEF